MSIALKIAKRVVIALFSLVIAFVMIFLLWRMLSSTDPASIKVLSPNERLAKAYLESGEELYMFRQDQRSVTSSEKNYGYFLMTQTVIIPDANQIQTVVKYNNSTLRHTAEDFGLSDTPSREDNVYDVTLLLAIDLTPEVEEDNYGNDEQSVSFVRCHGSIVSAEQKNLYNYRRIVFQLDDAQIDIKQLLDDKLLLAVYMDFYYKDAVDYKASPYGTLCMYDFKSDNVKVKLEREDINVIEAFGESK